MRQIVLDTETTGLEPADGHRIIEIGCVELLERRLTGNTYHQYIQPDRQIDAGAIEVHGITNESLADKPRFADIVDEFLDFVRGAELIIHNAPFDVGFLDHEFRLLKTSPGTVADHCTVLDTLALARRLHPGQRNNLDALCRRYEIDNSQRELHGALLDAEILADVYLVMTGGQVSLSLDSHSDMPGESRGAIRRLPAGRKPLRIIRADATETAAHDARLDAIDMACESGSVWRRGES
ncbi:MAG TPA: DNA polymerase III subunit epsilon [Gammaproteobacteria bacterium]|nr:DNA polymerase III subunit epsilon [Gammaproteobacteria bacterium]